MGRRRPDGQEKLRSGWEGNREEPGQGTAGEGRPGNWLAAGGRGRNDRGKGFMKHSANSYRNHRMPSGRAKGWLGSTPNERKLLEEAAWGV